jgi:hypothetical protein
MAALAADLTAAGFAPGPPPAPFARLTGLPVLSLTAERAAQLDADAAAAEAEAAAMRALTPEDAWRRDLDAFEAAWRAWLAAGEKEPRDETAEEPRDETAEEPRDETAEEEAADP